MIANHLVPKPVKNDMQIALANDAPVADGDNKLVKLRVIIPVKSLKFVQDAGEFTTAFAVYISTGDGDGNSSPVNRQTQQIRWAPDQMQKMSDKMIGFAVDVVVKPGRNQISVGVVDQRTQQTGFAKTIL